MKKFLLPILTLLFAVLVSCAPRDAQEADEISLDTIPEIHLEDPDPGLPPAPLQDPVRPTPPVEDIRPEDTPATQRQMEHEPMEQLQEEQMIQEEGPRSDTVPARQP